jgi:hypothetical protein
MYSEWTLLRLAIALRLLWNGLFFDPAIVERQTDEMEQRLNAAFE